jgi:hypothetical protein
VLNEVVLNQVLLAPAAASAADDDRAARIARLIAEIQREGLFWVGPTVWQGHPAIRVSVSGWRTTSGDIDRVAASFAAALVRAG